MINEKKYLKKCLKYLKFRGKTINSNEIEVNNEDEYILNDPHSKYYGLFGRCSVMKIIKYVASKLNLKITYASDKSWTKKLD